MKNKLMSFMRGRYGMDQLGKFILVICCILLVVALLTSRTVVGPIFYFLALALLIYSYVRMFSRKIDKRYRENMVYMSFRYRFTSRWARAKAQASQRKTHRFFKCPSCGTTVRVPKNKGKIRITCPKCKQSFIKTT